MSEDSGHPSSPNLGACLTVGHLLEALKDVDPKSPICMTAFERFGVSSASAEGVEGSCTDHCRIVAIATEAETKATYIMLCNASWNRYPGENEFSLQVPPAPWLLHYDYEAAGSPSVRSAWEQMNQYLGEPIFLESEEVGQ
jgi:hypothetical protein